MCMYVYTFTATIQIKVMLMGYIVLVYTKNTNIELNVINKIGHIKPKFKNISVDSKF